MKNPRFNESSATEGRSPAPVFNRGNYGMAAFTALAAFLLYLRTLGPTITGEDSGEFVVAAQSLGIPHPPGYPLYCLMGHLFTRIPIGEIAWRVNLMSASFAAGAVFLLVLILIRLTGNRVAAFAAGLALACSREFWAQAVIAEVYAMNVFWMAGCLLLLLQWHETRKDRALYLFSFCFGLGMTVHNTFLLLAAPCALFVWLTEFHTRAARPPDARPRIIVYALCCLLAASALLVYLYLPIRSRANPPLDWGNPETLRNAYHVVRRSQYDFMFHQYPRSVGRFLGQLAASGRFWLGEFGPGGAVVGALGLALLLRRRFAYAALLISSALLVVAGFAFWQNFEQTREWLWVMRVFGIPAYFVTAVGLGVCYASLWQWKPFGPAATIMVAFSVVSVSLVSHFPRNDKSDYYWTHDYGRNILDTLAHDAIYLSESDHGSFSVLYLQVVHGRRPDVENLRKYGYLQSDLFDDMPETLRAEVGEFPPRRHEPALIAWLLEHTDRPLYMAKPMRLPGIRVEPAGLLFRALRPGETTDDREYWNTYTWHSRNPEDTRGDYTADAILYEIAMVKAHGLLMEARRRGDDASTDALRHIEEGLAIYGRDPIVLNNAGVLCARYGMYDHARDYFIEALQRLPHLPEPARNLKRVQLRLSQNTPPTR